MKHLSRLKTGPVFSLLISVQHGDDRLNHNQHEREDNLDSMMLRFDKAEGA